MATKNESTIVIKPIKKESGIITIVGDSPLIVNAWSEKAKREMLEAQMAKEMVKGKKPKKNDPRDPFAEYMNALYWVTPKPEESTKEAFEAAIQAGAKFGFPTNCVKLAAITAAYRSGMTPNMVCMKGLFTVHSINHVQNSSGMDLAEIITDAPPKCREDVCKVGGIQKVSMLRYRPCFENWKMKLLITVNDVGLITMESVINAINIAGMMNGLGEWRMEKNGEFGMFHVEVSE